LHLGVRIGQTGESMQAANALVLLLLGLPRLMHAQQEPGIPVNDATVLGKCGTCHPMDEHGNMQAISWERSTPEGWGDAIKQMIRQGRVTLTPAEARAIVKYLSSQHGLAPAESKPVQYFAERRVADETGMANETLRNTCAKCHSLAYPLSWRRSLSGWQDFDAAHDKRYKYKANGDAIAYLAQIAPLQTPEWKAWSARTQTPEWKGRWLVTAHVPGRGRFYGEMDVQPGAEGEFLTRVSLQSINGGSAIVRTGRGVVYTGSAWRGRSTGANAAVSAPDDLVSEAREVMWIAPDGSKAEGRWFWGQYQEFGFDVTLQRPSIDPTLLASATPSLKVGSQSSRIRLIGDGFPAKVEASELSLGSGVRVRRIVSSTPSEIIAELDVDAGAPTGKHDISFRSSTLTGAIAVYDRVDYIKVTPESSLAAFGDPQTPRGYQQFEAIGYQRGADGKPHTADDVDLGPVDATWSMEIFYETDGSKHDVVGEMSPTGFFTPAAKNPNINFDIWAIATAKNENDKEAKPLVGKGYVVVTIPSYMFEGRKYVRELDRWIEEGSFTR
jgi:quinohemoprotein amine dehydrogenase